MDIPVAPGGSPAEIAHGPMLIGLFFTALLQGGLVLQCYHYYMNYREDKLFIKLYVLVIFVLNAVNTSFDFAYLYESLITHYGDISFLTYTRWTFNAAPITTGLIAALVQLFFAYRIHVLARNIWATSSVVILALAGFVGSIITSIECGIHTKFIEFKSFQNVVILWLVAGCACDVLITVILVLYLKQRKTGFKNTDDIVDRVVRMTIETGMITSVCAIVDLVTFLSLRSGLHLMFNFPLAKLYTVTLMTSLASRPVSQTTVHPSISMSSNHLQIGVASARHHQNKLEIKMSEDALNARDCTRCARRVSMSSDNITCCCTEEGRHRTSKASAA
ncbi:hypothetical protein CYLTODRAFT_420697 [Cylindrobasidium torrendii FP15055 ss-10]|uniref:DUF6534 domain-containing protein n=1 Tax=Cylindrobasidium torrendii FP15055 ss-10 TaxID=1314674 RepID=A0A0D7BGS2_9AGAR|nr:hypothetical protein CYLTODRAFT_420697 [Cylindrobasidium torrendii FP15055 ss-10]